MEEWHDPSLSADEKADLEEQIKERSLERNLLTPFTVLHVPKPALQEAMKSNLNGDDIDFDSIIFGRHRRSIEDRLQYQGSIIFSLKNSKKKLLTNQNSILQIFQTLNSATLESESYHLPMSR